MQGVKNNNLKSQAIQLRQNGHSYPMIEKQLGTPRATMSGWFRGLKLSSTASALILQRKKRSLKLNREKALVVLREQKEETNKLLVALVKEDLKKINFSVSVKELLLAMLYLGEGFKRRSTLGLGNSSGDIMSVFVNLLREIYHVEDKRLTCYLHLRYDQDPAKETNYWARVINLNKDRFRKPQFDKRTIGSKTWKSYHGVCIVYCHDAKIEKRLTLLQKLLLDRILLGG